MPLAPPITTATAPSSFILAGGCCGNETKTIRIYRPNKHSYESLQFKQFNDETVLVIRANGDLTYFQGLLLNLV